MKVNPSSRIRLHVYDNKIMVKQFIKTAQNIGGVIGDKTKEIGGNVGNTAKTVGNTAKNVGNKAKNLGLVIGDKAGDAAKKIGNGAKRTSKTIGDKTFDTAVSIGGVAMKIGDSLQKINLGKLIDDLEQKQAFADHLETVNEEIVQEQQRQELVREAEARCRATIIHHLHEFLVKFPLATYEEWISDLHPDNVTPTKQKQVQEKEEEIDHRFYVVDSDHRIIWNGLMEELRDGSGGDNNAEEDHYSNRMVPARSLSDL